MSWGGGSATSTLGGMAFPRRLLNDHEDLVLDLKPHWWFMSEPTAALVGALIIGIALLISFDNGFVKTVVAIAILGALLWFVARYTKWVSTNFVVTTDRLIYRYGVVAKHGIEIPLERVMNVIFNQTVFERVLGAGDLLIESGGRDGQQRFTDVRRPEHVQREIYVQMERNQNRQFDRLSTSMHSPSMPPPPPPRGPEAPPPEPFRGSVAEELNKLDELRQKGVLTQGEFEMQKRKLLGS